MLFFVYILQSLKDFGFYIGYTTNLDKRVRSHNLGLNRSTKVRRPFRLIYFEKYSDKTSALKREKQIKNYKGGEAFKRLMLGL